MMKLHGRRCPAYSSRALRLLFIISLAPFLHSLSRAQGPLWRIGAYGDIGFNFISGGFTNLPGVGKPPSTFGPSSSGGFGGGAFVEFAPGKLFGGAIRGGYQSLSATQTADEAVFIAVGGRPTRAIVRHTLFTSFTPIGIDGTFIIRPARRFELGLGGRIAFFTSSRFEQSQQLIAPAAVFVRDPDTLRGPIPTAASQQISAIARIGYTFPLNRRGSLVLMPELSGMLGLTNLASGVNWKGSTITAGIAIGFGGGTEEAVRYDTLYRRDTVTSFSIAAANEGVVLIDRRFADQPADVAGTRVVTTTVTESYRHDVPRPAPVLAGSLRVRFVLPNGKDTGEIGLQIRESLVRRLVALPWTIVPSSGSGSLPPDLRRLTQEEARTFSLDRSGGPDPQNIHAQQLNILGKRLREHPGATVTLLSPPDDPPAASLADTIRGYLRDVWRIEPARLIDERGRGEQGGGVSLVASDPAILAPVEGVDTVKRAILPEVRFYPVTTSEAGIRGWRITIGQGENEGVAMLEGRDDPPAAIVWEPANEPGVRDPSTYPLRYRLTLEDQAGQRSDVANGSILFKRSRYQKAPGEIGDVEYTLPADERWLRDHPELLRDIHAAILPGTRVSVTGYGDVRELAARIARDLDIPTDRVRDVPAGSQGAMGNRIVVSIVDETESR